MNTLMGKFDRIDADSRLLFAEMTLADPLSGEHVRGFIELNVLDYGCSSEHAATLAIGWRIVVRLLRDA